MKRLVSALVLLSALGAPAHAAPAHAALPPLATEGAPADLVRQGLLAPTYPAWPGRRRAC